MNTLQLYISKSARESARLAEINPTDEGRRAASDMKAAVALVDYPPSAKTVFFIVANVQGGYAIHIIRTIPPTKPNHLDATIFVDKSLDIMAEDLQEVLDSVSATVLAKAVTEEDMKRLRELFSREYDLRDKAPRIKPSRGSDYAFISYGKDASLTLSDILAEGLYRPEWSDYKAVCLLDESLSPLPNSMTDLNANYDESADEDPTDDSAYEADAEEPKGRAGAPASYVFSIPVTMPDGRSELEFELESSRPIQRSPIAGYAVSGKIVEGTERVNRLHRSTDKTLYERFEKWIWGVGGLFAGILLMVIAGLFSDSSAERQAADAYKSVQPATQSAQPTDASVTSATTESNSQNTSATQPQPTEATAYLDNNRIWRLEDMEKIDGLQGLFDDMNNYRFEEITGKWADSLGASKNFAKVVKAAEKSVSKKVDPRRHADHSPSYNREGDTGIGWLGYTFWIDP
ncbi:MAG: hypothetical protein K2K94_07055 [Muribaculaceae bacterium]|nr:hypothetical protein [Muribaculaceae bacterium]